jgi:hypothetical protein
LQLEKSIHPRNRTRAMDVQGTIFAKTCDEISAMRREHSISAVKTMRLVELGLIWMTGEGCGGG